MDGQITVKNLNDEFAEFTGTEHYYRHWLPVFVYTDGIKMMAEKYQAYWLLDIVFSWQSKDKVSREKFQIWTLEVSGKKGEVLMRPDCDKPVITCQRIPFTDFPEGMLKMYFIDDGTNKVLLLPSEY